MKKYLRFIIYGLINALGMTTMSLFTNYNFWITLPILIFNIAGMTLVLMDENIKVDKKIEKVE